MASGWIKISRDIQTHWIYQDSEKLKWWLDLLLLANYEDKELNIKYKVFKCKRGQLLYSLKSLSQRWNVSKSVVNNFLEMLRKQNMIETENETVTTRITICNYDTYQQIENANETQLKRKRNAIETQHDTTKEYKEIQETIEQEIKHTCFSFVDFWSVYPNKTNKSEAEKKYNKLSETDRQLIKDSIQSFINFKPFKDYNYPMPNTYINQKRWNDYISNEPKQIDFSQNENNGLIDLSKAFSK